MGASDRIIVAEPESGVVKILNLDENNADQSAVLAAEGSV